MNTEYISKDGKDLCVSCKTETQYKTETPIVYRKNYVEGAGQLCDSCFEKIYKK